MISAERIGVGDFEMDADGFGEAAFEVARRAADHFETEFELIQFLQAERDEQLRQSVYYESVLPIFSPAAANACEEKARAYQYLVRDLIGSI